MTSPPTPSTFIALVLHYTTDTVTGDDLHTFVERVTENWIGLVGTNDHGSWVDLEERLIRLEMAHPDEEIGVTIATGAALRLRASSFGVEGVRFDGRWTMDVVLDAGPDDERVTAYLHTTRERNTAYRAEREYETRDTATEP
ncbi:hypothetical protein [Saccharopolyspora elongata]|uniref:Uncharacterized protein n=1 Tax=Saccharopolyspora elongata TaxID=2530387 RepID=A0A4R4Y789_9PSEU|nr:hypothetical protein [Saccharopolyspora elongata]TDD40281.1 hypothetical protein E1288_35720 [Saccharopolyspora elongata]